MLDFLIPGGSLWPRDASEHNEAFYQPLPGRPNRVGIDCISDQ